MGSRTKEAELTTLARFFIPGFLTRSKETTATTSPVLRGGFESVRFGNTTVVPARVVCRLTMLPPRNRSNPCHHSNLSHPIRIDSTLALLYQNLMHFSRFQQRRRRVRYAAEAYLDHSCIFKNVGPMGRLFHRGERIVENLLVIRVTSRANGRMMR